jgi:hypothetical protein
MNRYLIAIGVLASAVVVLSIGLVFAVIDDDGMHDGRGGYAGMMGALGQMDSDQMLVRMREVLSDEDYQRMLEHIQAHRGAMGMSSDTRMDQMMHRMMDGMMAEMPMDRDGMMGRP